MTLTPQDRGQAQDRGQDRPLLGGQSALAGLPRPPLANGWPISTGVIEGACRHLVKDRMDITGARWGTETAEAILKLRALQANGDFDEYWIYHRHREHQRNHPASYQLAA